MNAPMSAPPTVPAEAPKPANPEPTQAPANPEPTPAPADPEKSDVQGPEQGKSEHPKQ